MFEGERLRILSVECVSGSHNLTLLSSVEQTLTESSPNDLNAKQRPRALVKKKKDDNREDKVGGRGKKPTRDAQM